MYKDTEKKITKRDLISMFIRSNFHQGSWNFERMQALGYCFEMIPIIKRLYHGEERKKALKRHLEFFNTHPFVTSPILGVTAAMEEQRSEEHTSELQSRQYLVCRLLLEKKKTSHTTTADIL